LLAPLVLLLGCSNAREKTYKTLAELETAQMWLILNEGTLTLELLTQPYEGCPSFAGTARMNGRPVELVEPGGYYEEVAGVFVPMPVLSCRSPKWRLPMPPPQEEVTELVIEDATGRLRMGVYNLGVERGVRYREPTTSSLRWGQLVEVEVIPGTDGAGWALPASLVTGSDVPVRWWVEYADVDPDLAREGLLRFRLPEQPPEGLPPVIRDAKLVFYQGSQVFQRLAYCEPTPETCLTRIHLPLSTRIDLPISIE
jgi:hypothetical protein